MSFEIDEATQTISITRGDSGLAEIPLIINDVLHEMKEGDAIEFGVKANYSDKECLIHKVMHRNPGILEIVPGDTKDLKFGTYKYDVQFVDGETGFTRTFIEKKKFKITEEVV